MMGMLGKAMLQGLSEAPGGGLAAYEDLANGFKQWMQPLMLGLVDKQAAYDATQMPAQSPTLGPRVDRALSPGYAIPDTGAPAIVRTGARALGPTLMMGGPAVAGGGLSVVPRMLAGGASGAMASEGARQIGAPPWAQMVAGIAANGAVDATAGGLTRWAKRKDAGPSVADMIREAASKRLKAAAIRVQGRTFTGVNHSDAMDAALKAGVFEDMTPHRSMSAMDADGGPGNLDPQSSFTAAAMKGKGLEQGFLTETGDFVDRATARKWTGSGIAEGQTFRWSAKSGEVK